MSFIISVYVNEGLVLASDRRVTYSKTENIDNKIRQQIGLHVTNSTDKTFLCPNNSGISTCGSASLLGKPITGFIQEMIRTKINIDTRVQDMPQIVIDYFYNLSSVPSTNFIIAGYGTSETGEKKQFVYKIQLKNKLIENIETDSQGACWDGETLTFSRLINDIAIKQGDEYIDVKNEEIAFSYFTLQDAVDFARFAVETTINTMRFKNVIETVGGNVDILVITPSQARWLQKEELH